MFLNHAQLESATEQILFELESHFCSDWVRYPKHPGGTFIGEGYPETYVPQMTPHRCRLFEFCIAMEGTVFLQVEQQTFRLEQGQVCLIPAGAMHVELTDRTNLGTSAFFVFLDDGVWINHSTSHHDGSFSVCHGSCVSLDPIRYTLALKDLSKEIRKQGYGAATCIKCSVLQLLMDIIRELKKQESKMTAEEWKSSVVRQIIFQLEASGGNTPDLTELAERCAMSANHLSSIFKAVTGKTITAYCSDLRIRQAEHLLLTTSLKLRQLAEQLGYYDQYHFCKAFKKATGMSPSEYRQSKKQ